jgi:hypothetical protein
MKTQIKKNNNKTNKKKIIKPKVSSDYIIIDGVTYEKMSNDSVNVELDLASDVIDCLDDLVKKGKFVSRGDAIRTILRKKIEQIELETK